MLALAAAGGAQAATQTFTTAQSEFNPGFRNQGWFEPSMNNLPESDNYFAGRTSGHIAYNAARGGFFSIGGVVDPPGSIVGLFAGGQRDPADRRRVRLAGVRALACIFERAAHRRPAFRAKYGRGPLHLFAMRRCVRRASGG